MTQTTDPFGPILIDASEICPGDFIRDLGTLREVESVDLSGDQCARGICVRFVGGTAGRYATLRIPEHVQIAVWQRSDPGPAAGDPHPTRPVVGAGPNGYAEGR